MDFAFSAEQDDFRQAVRATLDAEAPPTYVRAMMEDPVGVTPELWQTMAELGWLGVLVPESAGGLGLGLVDLVVLQEELGALPFPGPFLSSAVLATLAAVRLGAEGLLADLTSGRRRGTVALEEAGHGAPLATVHARAVTGADGQAVLEGHKPLVLDGASADWALVVARDDTGLASFLLDAPAGEPVPALDVTRKVARLPLDGRRA
ncbi:MAG TPA: acyl-CoA dehydrogenase family protein, partial [Acidimicrobiales bacterium]|nr:acyl-CoA dehydrogenase family protein [Acidimicrobiales bacterium]